jgi:hypothetical protein
MLDMFSVFWTCLDEFEYVQVWIHVETAFVAEMRFIYDIVVIYVMKCEYIVVRMQENRKK